MIKQALISIAFGTLVLGAQGAAAQQFNGGMPAGWACVGVCGTSGANGVVELSPISSSTQYGWISTDPSDPSHTFSGVSPFSPLSNFIGNTNGSTLTSSTFHANAGDQLSFYFNYVTSDGVNVLEPDDFKDYGWSRLLNAGDSSQAAVLITMRTDPGYSYIPGQGLPPGEATLTPPSSAPVFNYSPLHNRIGMDTGLDIGPQWSPLGASSGKCWGEGCGYTGWFRANYTIASTGDYLLEFGVTNWNDFAYDSGMAIDGIVISQGNGGVTSPVPEPEAYAMLLAGLSLFGLSARRRKQY